MQRISTPSAVPDLFGPGKPGFTDGDPVGGIPATWLNAVWFNGLQEEVAAVIEDAGYVLDAGDNTQLLQALRRLIQPGYLNRTAWLPVLSVTQANPPAAPKVGDLYVIPNGATGAWAGHVGKLAEWSGSWTIITTKDGHGVSLPDGRLFVRVGGTYVERGQVAQAVSKSGLIYNTTDQSLLTRAMRSQRLNYVVAGGTAAALTATLDPPPTALSELIGMPIRLALTINPNIAATLNVNGLGPLPIGYRDGRRPFAGELAAGQTVDLTLNDAGTTFVLSSRAPIQVGAAVDLSGLSYGMSDDFLLAKAMRSQRLNYSAATGSANALTIALDPAPTDLSELVGTPIRLLINATQTGSATLKVGNLAAVPIRYRDGRDLFAGELTAGDIVEVVLNASRNAFIIGAAPLQLGTTSLRDQRVHTDLAYIANTNPADPSVATSGTLIGEVTLPAGHISYIAHGVYHVGGGTSATEIYVSIFLRVASGAWVPQEFGVQQKAAGQTQLIGRPALRTLDPTKSHTIRCVGYKSAATGAVTPPTGNLQVQGHKI